VFRLNKADQKNHKSGADDQTDKLLMHSGVGELCCEGGPEAWIAHAKGTGDAKYSQEHGLCFLCQYIIYEELLNNISDREHEFCNTGEHVPRAQDYEAIPFPRFDQKGIYWDQYFPETDKVLTAATRSLIQYANTETGSDRPIKAYTSHSNKVGGSWEAMNRQWHLHEIQRATGHARMAQMLLYAQNMEKRDEIMLVSELQRPPLRLTHDFHNTRTLQQCLLDGHSAVKVVLNKQEHTEKKHSLEIKNLEEQHHLQKQLIREEHERKMQVENEKLLKMQMENAKMQMENTWYASLLSQFNAMGMQVSSLFD